MDQPLQVHDVWRSRVNGLCVERCACTRSDAGATICAGPQLSVYRLSACPTTATKAPAPTSHACRDRRLPREGEVARPGSAASGARGRLIFALDATMSRQPTWDTACALQADMFREAAAVGGLDIQLVYFRGLNECRASGWVAGSDKLAALMSRIDCRGGHTQIGKVLAHARQEHARQRVQALVFVGDAMEEPIDDLCAAGRRARPARRAGVHVPGRPRRGRRERLSRDRAAVARRLLPLRCRRGAPARANCCARSRPMPPAAARRWPRLSATGVAGAQALLAQLK